MFLVAHDEKRKSTYHVKNDSAVLNDFEVLAEEEQAYQQLIHAKPLSARCMSAALALLKARSGGEKNFLAACKHARGKHEQS